MNIDLLWYQCKTCGNKCLVSSRPSNEICGGCIAPDWRLMRHQQAYQVGESDWVHPDGEEIDHGVEHGTEKKHPRPKRSADA